MAKNSVRQDENTNSISNKDLIFRLFDYLKPYKLKVFFILVLLIYVMICGLLNPYLMKLAIDKYISQKNLQGLVIIAIVMFILNFLSMIASAASIRMMAKVTNTVLLEIRQQLYKHIQKLSFSFFDNRPVGKILARVIGDVNSLQELFSTSITSFIPEILTLICVTFIMFYMNFQLALVSILVLPFLAITLFSIETISRKRWQIYRKKRSNLNAYTHEDFSGIRVIKGFAEEEKTSSNFLLFTKDMMNSFVKAVRLNDSFWPIVTLSSGVGTVLVFGYGVSLIKWGSMTIGTMVAFISYVSMFWRPIINISNFYNTLITNFAAGERIFEILDIEPDIIDIKNHIMPKIKGTVQFKNLTFSYDNHTNTLNNINFKINPGETIALVGSTGSGKTTIVNLISRFYDATKGEVLIDGKDVKNFTIESLRSQMGIMLQDTFLFSSTIRENIRYGKLDATDEEVIAAAKSANAHNFIINLEKGYDTEVNERGSRLSVGQRQLISFARALLANPRILILDEATSNIDTYTEKLVQEGIQKLLIGRTSFVIAHRLSTIRNADKIMVIDNGNIAEAGTHKELMKLKGLYHDLFMSQYKFLNEAN
ncbi:ABC transporter ATP-binding protein [Clostridium pasteurianum]|uniref:ABC-type multidrug transport system, ATPase and permease component n=1 Tax=Clostridium pasteurianum BC1 TaxID=86416 RepID=R4K7Y1_CLOPA|nr:ABC transporter ATP-binding protein [Clostridium pasteurianum]AGK99292.1 ABC-type multidrug transport system, ATPase and permease component [Clostridium pasteurianum BC1]